MFYQFSNKMKKNLSKKKGFTFIETLTVITIIGLVLPVLFTIIYSILREQAKINAVIDTKNEGDAAFTIVQNLLRNNVISVHNSSNILSQSTVRCSTYQSTYPNPASSDGSNVFFQDKNNNWFQIILTDDGKIASNSSIPNAYSELTTSKVVIDNFKISCTGTSLFSAPLISFSYRATYNNSSKRAEDNASLNYQTKIKVRSLE